MKFLFILNDPPYGTERSYNALRHARELLKDGSPDVELKVFLIGDASAGAHAGQKVPQGYYSIEALLRGLTARGAEVGVCGTCMDARGLGDADLTAHCVRSTMAQLAAWSNWADKVLVY
ncbi:MAG: DsrE family protein [Burkholderiales bacterium]